MGERRSVSGTADPHWPQLLLCVVLAPVLSAIFYGLAGRLTGVPDTLAMLSPVVWMFVLFYGLVPSLLFGSIGCILAERFLSAASPAMWSVAGALAASAYVAASLGATALGLEAAGFFAPWRVVEGGRDALGMDPGRAGLHRPGGRRRRRALSPAVEAADGEGVDRGLTRPRLWPI